MTDAGAIPAPVIQVAAPRFFGPRAIAVCHGYGLLFLVPTLVSILAVASLPLNWWSAAVPFLILGASVFCLPVGFGNPHIARIAAPLRPASATGELFLVQFTFDPRVRGGLRALLEDADDIGWLAAGDHALEFYGDSVRLTFPYAHLASATLENNGLRGLFLYSRVAIRTTAVPSLKQIRVAERSTWLLPGSSALTRRLCRDLQRRIPSQKPAG